MLHNLNQSNVSAALTNETPAAPATPATTSTLTTPATPATPPTPSISSSSMLVELSISQWTGRKLDRKASEDVTAQNEAETGVANVNKKLLADCAELVAVHKLTGSIRNLSYSMTLPWSDTGLRLIPTARYFKYHQQMTALQTEWENAVASFLQGYEWEISKAEVKLGRMFHRDEYPTVSSLTNKFAFRLSYIPLPEAGDFRIDVGNEAMTQITQHYQDYYSRQLTNAMNDIWHRTYDALSTMSDRLDYSDADTKKVFKKGLVENVLKMVDMLDVYNVGNDSQMAAMKVKLETAMRGITPEALREDEYLRRETKRAVDEVLAQLPSIDL
jgi:hypothetical protein